MSEKVRTKKDVQIKNLALSAMFAAMIFALTFSFKVPIPGGGYIHIGDAMIYVCAMVLPMPLAMLAGAVGGALSDIIGGYFVYAPITFVIKGLLALVFSLIRTKTGDKKLLTVKSALMTIPASLITVGGYFAAEYIFLDKAAAAAGVVGNIGQAVGCGILFIVLAFFLDKTNVFNKIGLDK